MLLPKFEHVRPTSIKEAADLLDEYGPRAKVVAGGTDLFPRMKYGLLRPEFVISLKGVTVAPPALEEDGTLCLDALMTLADAAHSPLISERAPLLAESALKVASNQVRHMATLGGNLCLETRCQYYNQSHTFQFGDPCLKRGGNHCYLLSRAKKCEAVFMGDTAPALMCLDGKVEIRSPNGSRRVPVSDLYTGNPLSPMTLSGSEIVEKVILPAPAPKQGAAFSKYSIRGGVEFGALNVAVLLVLAKDGTHVERARIVVGSVGAKPQRTLKAESVLIGEVPGEAVTREAARKTVSEVRLVMHHDFSVPFLRECLRVQVHRALMVAIGRMSGKEDLRWNTFRAGCMMISS